MENPDTADPLVELPLTPVPLTEIPRTPAPKPLAFPVIAAVRVPWVVFVFVILKQPLELLQFAELLSGSGTALAFPTLMQIARAMLAVASPSSNSLILLLVPFLPWRDVTRARCGASNLRSAARSVQKNLLVIGAIGIRGRRRSLLLGDDQPTQQYDQLRRARRARSARPLRLPSRQEGLGERAP